MTTLAGVTAKAFVLQVPLFIEEGMMVKVDTRDGKYLSRAK